MGFHNGAYATVWSVEDMGKYTKVQLSTSSKNRETGEYETDWSDFASFVGAAHQMAKSAGLQKKDRIHIIGCDERNRYDSQAKKKYYNHVVFEFEPVSSNNSGTTKAPAADTRPATDANYSVEEDPF